MIIKDKETLREVYSLMLVSKHSGKFTKLAKKAIRNYYKDQNEKAAAMPEILVGNDYGYIELVTVPAGEDPKTYFENEIRIRYINRGYDCTGQCFTAYHHFTSWHGQPAIIHRVAVDN